MALGGISAKPIDLCCLYTYRAAHNTADCSNFMINPVSHSCNYQVHNDGIKCET